MAWKAARCRWRCCSAGRSSTAIADAGALQIDQISWSKEAAYRLPVRLWQETDGRYYPNSAWLRLDRDVFDAFYRYKRQGGFTTWEKALASLLERRTEKAS